MPEVVWNGVHAPAKGQASKQLLLKGLEKQLWMGQRRTGNSRVCGARTPVVRFVSVNDDFVGGRAELCTAARALRTGPVSETRRKWRLIGSSRARSADRGR